MGIAGATISAGSDPFAPSVRNSSNVIFATVQNVFNGANSALEVFNAKLDQGFSSIENAGKNAAVATKDVLSGEKALRELAALQAQSGLSNAAVANIMEDLGAKTPHLQLSMGMQKAALLGGKAVRSMDLPSEGMTAVQIERMAYDMMRTPAFKAIEASSKSLEQRTLYSTKAMTVRGFANVAAGTGMGVVAGAALGGAGALAGAVVGAVAWPFVWPIAKCMDMFNKAFFKKDTEFTHKINPFVIAGGAAMLGGAVGIGSGAALGVANAKQVKNLYDEKWASKNHEALKASLVQSLYRELESRGGIRKEPVAPAVDAQAQDVPAQSETPAVQAARISAEQAAMLAARETEANPTPVTGTPVAQPSAVQIAAKAAIDHLGQTGDSELHSLLMHFQSLIEGKTNPEASEALSLKHRIIGAIDAFNSLNPDNSGRELLTAIAKGDILTVVDIAKELNKMGEPATSQPVSPSPFDALSLAGVTSGLADVAHSDSFSRRDLANIHDVRQTLAGAPGLTHVDGPVSSANPVGVSRETEARVVGG